MSWQSIPDWAKFLVPAAITGIGGFVGGRFIKRLDYNDEKKRLRRALYAELGANLQTMLGYQMDLSERLRGAPRPVPGWTTNWLHKEVYTDALTKRPVMFRDLKEAKYIDDFYLGVARALEQAEGEDQKTALIQIQSWVRALLPSAGLSRRELYRSMKPLNAEFQSGFQRWIDRRYRRLVFRNVDTRQGGQMFAPSPGLFKKLKAIWKGIPGDRINPPGVSQ
jgi:hypothetical protein